jgi:hypothetical protein
MPKSLDALAAVSGFRRWRVEAFGAELAEILSNGKTS